MTRIVIVGATGSSHIGGSLWRGAEALSMEAELCDVNRAWRHGTLKQKLLWRFAGRRPAALNEFSAVVLKKCEEFKPDILLSTGNAPVRREVLYTLRDRGVKCVNFSTDDPFSPRQPVRWFLEAVSEYDLIFTPRRANFEDFAREGCRRVEYLPFGYDPELFFPEETSPAEESDLFFAGTAEAARAEYINNAINAGFDVRLHGSYWHRFGAAGGVSRGQADIATLRRAICSCKVALCVVRHDNRDGHSMRTFELPAVGACMVVEDTTEHREIFGADKERVIYFTSPEEMVNAVRALLDEPDERRRLKQAVHDWVTSQGNTYADRLKSMIQLSMSTT